MMLTKRQIGWGIGAVVVLLVIAAVVVVINMARSRAGRFNGEDRAAVEQRLRLQIDACKEAQDPGICARQAVVPQAELMGDARLCTLLEGEAVGECVETVAIASMDKRACESLEGGDQRGCEDRVAVLKAIETLDVGECEEISDEAEQVACVAQVTARVVDDGTCVEHGIDVMLCNERTAFNQAFASGDVSACDRLSDEGAVASCKDEVRQTLPDPDEDVGTGRDLSTEEGRVPRGAGSGSAGGAFLDSDGDGYDDATEIRNGFDPYGPGRL